MKWKIFQSLKLPSQSQFKLKRLKRPNLNICIETDSHEEMAIYLSPFLVRFSPVRFNQTTKLSRSMQQHSLVDCLGNFSLCIKNIYIFRWVNICDFCNVKIKHQKREKCEYSKNLHHHSFELEINVWFLCIYAKRVSSEVEWTRRRTFYPHNNNFQYLNLSDSFFLSRSLLIIH